MVATPYLVEVNARHMNTAYMNTAAHICAAVFILVEVAVE